MGDKFYIASYRFEQQKLSIDESATDLPGDMSDKERLINFVDTKEPVFGKGDADWRFGDHRVIDEKDFLVGRFGKEFEDKPKQYDEEVGEFMTQKGRDADVSHFILYFDIQIIAFNRKLRIGPSQFINAFSKGFNSYYDIGKNMSVELEDEKTTIEEVLNSADSVSKISFDLETTNPEANEEMEAMDNRYKDAKAETFVIELFSDIGLDTVSDVIRAGKEFVVEKYGDAKIWYETDGKKRQFNTKTDSTVYQAEDEPEDLEDVENEADGIKDQSMGITEQKD